jgi:spore coat polysaccharide biosynthesis predicted glycosyltransferase SpsG
VTIRVLEALTQVEVPDLEIVVVVGGSNPHMDSLQQAAQDVPHTIRLLQNATHMPELMAWADLAIAAGGSTLWELAFLGVPTLTLILAANQYPAAQLLGERGLIINLGWHTAVAPPTLAAGIAGLLRDSTQRAAMARQGQGWCWGRTGGRGDEYI